MAEPLDDVTIQRPLGAAGFVASMGVALAVLAGITFAWGGRVEGQLIERRPRAELNGEHIPDFDAMYPESRPEVVVVGNSVAAAAIDIERLGEALDRRTLGMIIHGSASAIWYLILKNEILPRDTRPDTVVLMFRDVYLTEPDYRIRGPYANTVDWLAGPEEPLLDRLAYFRESGALSVAARRHWSLWRGRDDLRSETEALAKAHVAPWLAGATPEELKEAVGRVFAEERKRPDAISRLQLETDTKIDPEHFRFGPQLRRSFLPELIRLAKDAGIQLIVVRAPNRRTAEAAAGDLELPEWATVDLPRYMTELREYLDEQGVPLLDFDGDPRIPFEWFAAGDHLNPDPGMVRFTGFLAERLRPLMR